MRSAPIQPLKNEIKIVPGAVSAPAFRTPSDHAAVERKSASRGLMLDPKPGATEPFETY